MKTFCSDWWWLNCLETRFPRQTPALWMQPPDGAWVDTAPLSFNQHEYLNPCQEFLCCLPFKLPPNPMLHNFDVWIISVVDKSHELTISTSMYTGRLLYKLCAGNNCVSPIIFLWVLLSHEPRTTRTVVPERPFQAPAPGSNHEDATQVITKPKTWPTPKQGTIWTFLNLSHSLPYFFASNFARNFGQVLRPESVRGSPF